VPALNDKNVVIIPFCEEPACEERIKELTKSDDHKELGPDGKPLPSMGMKSLCIPFDQVGDSGSCSGRAVADVLSVLAFRHGTGQDQVPEPGVRCFRQVLGAVWAKLLE
jgi:hypothetical protein